jgi:hypothetical protein
MRFSPGNSQPSDNGSPPPKLSGKRLDDALHFARKHEQRVWGSGEHESARAEVERLEALKAQHESDQRP